MILNAFQCDPAEGRITDPAIRDRPMTLDRLMVEVAEQNGVIMAELVGPSQVRRIANVRKVAARKAWALGYAVKDIAASLGRERSTVARILGDE